ncbi:hypothetical protein ACSVDE_17645 [Pseudalkalibacillus sp. Hm43]
MNFEIFMGLIGVPVGIILTAIICYFVTGKKEKNASVEVNKEGGIPK